MTLKEARAKLWATELESSNFMKLINTILFSFSSGSVTEYVRRLDFILKQKKTGRKVIRRDFLDILDAIIEIEKSALGKVARKEEDLFPLTDELELCRAPGESKKFATKAGISFYEED